MAITPTYPGVYIEEVPSGVHTITGVATSKTAFLGYTARGPLEPTEIFSFADFERSFGGLAADSPLSYAVSQFFQNGGGDAFIVRIASGASAAHVDLKDAAGAAVLTLTASSAGTWGNALQADVDYDTSNPSSLFNLTLTEYVQQDGNAVPNRVETFRNLSMDQFAPGYVIDTLNSGSKLASAAIVGGDPQTLVFGAATSVSGTLTVPSDLNLLTAGGTKLNHVTVAVNGGAPVEVTFFDATAPATLADVATDIQNAVNAVLGPNAIAGAVVGSTVSFTAAAAAKASRTAIHFLPSSHADASRALKLGVANGGVEKDAASAVRPVPTGTTGLPLSGAAFTGDGSIEVDVSVGGTQVANPTIVAWTSLTLPADTQSAAAKLQTALNANASPYLATARVTVVGKAIRVVAGGSNPNAILQFKDSGGDTAADQLQILHGLAGVTENVAHANLGMGLSQGFQTNAVGGSDGIAPQDADYLGNAGAKTGMYGLEKVDLFNLLCLVDVTTESVLATAAAYCERRRAFLIFDMPANVTDVPGAHAWMLDTARGAQIKSRNAAVYWPRILASDPLLNNRVRAMPACGAMAGVYARTDGERGVWKAPAGSTAFVSGAAGLVDVMTDAENGTLNPIAVNCLRAFPTFGVVAWGARTTRGADALADDYKYVPIRRLALFLEESLYRGTQWVVFEPNDEPLWAQIRLNVGAFMHEQFSQGAFAGQTPKDAYFVRCDKNTTTPADVDLGRVNVIVGFAPLKPAEFVIIRIQQIVPALAT
jgi:phage tail sheath protein FI